ESGTGTGSCTPVERVDTSSGTFGEALMGMAAVSGTTWVPAQPPDENDAAIASAATKRAMFPPGRKTPRPGINSSRDLFLRRARSTRARRSCYEGRVSTSTRDFAALGAHPST